MSRAEDRALELYPIENGEVFDANGDIYESDDKNYAERFAYIKGYRQAEKDVLDAIEKELTRRMLEDYNTGAEEDEIAQGCMASLIMFVRQMKEE